jgi:chromosome partitioning protein
VKVVTIAAPKGGSTKTGTTCLLAVRAMQDGKNVVMVDVNSDQANLTQWWVSRGQPFNPYLAQVEHITRDVQALRASNKYGWCFLDTPPLDMDVIENCVVVADAVVVPVRTSVFDVGSVDAIVEMCRDHHKPFSFLLSAVDIRFKALTASAVAAIVDKGPVFGTRISYRLPYINALTAGKTGPEIDKGLQPEADALWIEVKKLAERGAKLISRPTGRVAND